MLHTVQTALRRVTSLSCLLLMTTLAVGCVASSKTPLNEQNMGKVDPGGTLMYAREWMSVRESASNSAAVIAKTAPGDAVVNLGKQQGGWTYVRPMNTSLKGWMPTKSLSASKDVTKKTESMTGTAKPKPAPAPASSGSQSSTSTEQTKASTPEASASQSTNEATESAVSSTPEPTPSSKTQSSVLSPDEAQAATKAPTSSPTPSTTARPPVKPEAFDPF
ncbi:SH3 domain-containing protein [Desulfovibrio inopinatus]|uniref:SH3 domain-containing protein n=1 Tax=Desulfovibrio inopinatus TaxID=102109 RepID=UPI0003FC2949|nr:SH3 domain-containing protein [Desulfovibrio inopinatus]